MSIGGLAIFPDGRSECFGAEVDDVTADSWRSRADQKQVIGQAELFPFLVARLTWAERIKGKRVLYFVDNESARIGMIRAYSPILPSLKIIMQCVSLDFELNSAPWYARVPTASNPGDLPSRMVYGGASKFLGAKIVAPVLPEGTGTKRVL